jgi:hypothetical protein
LTPEEVAKLLAAAKNKGLSRNPERAIKDWMVKRQEMSLDALTLGAGNTLFISERRGPLERSNVCKMVNTLPRPRDIGAQRSPSYAKA